MSAKQGSEFDWQGMIDQSYLAIYQDSYHGSTEKCANTTATQLDYDYTFYFRQAIVKVLVCHEVMYSGSIHVRKSALHLMYKKAVNIIMRRHQQIQRKQKKPLKEDKNLPVFYLGIASVSVLHEKDVYTIDYQFGSRFFQEECVLDLDNENQVIQIFGVHSFVKILQQLQTPNDFMAFLQYHRQCILHQSTFDNETQLMIEFMSRPTFFVRGLEVEEKLLSLGLLGQIDKRLQNAVAGDKGSIEVLLEKMQSCSAIWIRLVRGCIKRHQQAGTPLSIHIIKRLTDESMYTRMNIIEEFLAYSEKSIEEHQEGYICHQHSYNYFGKHYMMVIYGLDENSALSRANVQEQQSSMLMEVNSQLQSPVMEDLFLLGFDMSAQDADGNIEVQMDVFYQEGVEMTTVEKNLYEQLNKLKAENQALRLQG